MPEITLEQRSAIIGYWRMGAPLEQIALITGIYYFTIEKIILDYELTLSLKN